MKKIFRSKKFLFSVLAAACIGILAVCLVVNRDRDNNFQPEDVAANTGTQEWQEFPAPAADTATPSPARTPALAATKEPLEEYPRVVDESESEVVIDFTPEGEELRTEPPEPPVAEGDPEDPSAPPTYAPEETSPEPTAPPAQSNTPAPGSTNENGAVYDPVFGWVIPSQVEQTTSDSNGDPNKMVGDM